MRKFFGKCLSTKFDLRLKKKQKKIGVISILLGKIIKKNASHTVFTYGNFMITFFFITRLFYLVQLAAETSSNLFNYFFFEIV